MNVEFAFYDADHNLIQRCRFQYRKLYMAWIWWIASSGQALPEEEQEEAFRACIEKLGQELAPK